MRMTTQGKAGKRAAVGVNKLRGYNAYYDRTMGCVRNTREKTGAAGATRGNATPRNYGNDG